MEGPVSGRRIKRRTVRNIIIFTVAVTLLVTLITGVIYVSDKLAQHGMEKDQAGYEQIANRIAGEITKSLRTVSDQLDQISSSAALLEQFTDPDEGALAGEAETIAASIEHVLKVRLFVPGNYNLDRDAKPPLGYASIDLLKAAETSTAKPGAELHGFSGPDAHVVLIRRISDASGKLAGLLHVSLDPKPFITLPKQANAIEGYIELVQGSGKSMLKLNSTGNKQYRHGPALSVTVPGGSQWRIDYWPQSSQAVAHTGESTSTSILLYLAVIVLLLGLAGGVIFTRRTRTMDNGENIASNVVFGGAIKAIMDGLHPGLEKLLPNLPDVGQSKPVEPISRGLNTPDATNGNRTGKSFCQQGKTRKQQSSVKG
jgi:phosphomannomutase / phosphoglucomutase